MQIHGKEKEIKRTVFPFREARVIVPELFDTRETLHFSLLVL